MRYEVITKADVNELATMYVDTFNAPPWNDEWTIETATKRLSQMILSQDFFGLKAYQNSRICGMILGNEEQFYDGIMFNIKEFCVANDLQNQGIGTKILEELERRLLSKGISEIVLFTSRKDGTEGFYQKRGYKSYNSMVMMGKFLKK